MANINRNQTFEDSTTKIVDNSDNTKIIQFQASGITTATTRTITMPDTDVSLIDASATATAAKLYPISTGTIIQVVSALGTGGGDETITDTVNFKVTSLTATITPKISTSKIIAMCFPEILAQGDGTSITVRAAQPRLEYGNSASVGSTSNGTLFPGTFRSNIGRSLIAASTAVAFINMAAAISGEYSPASVSALTVVMTLRAGGANQQAIYRNANARSSIYLFEVAA